VHEASPDTGQVIWYDAVTVAGDLKWQCRVNHSNHAFLLASGLAYNFRVESVRF
jgi:endo-beta-N-acetylglucosaminidase D